MLPDTFQGCTYDTADFEVRPWPNTCATHYYSQLGLKDNNRGIKEFVVYIIGF